MPGHRGARAGRRMPRAWTALCLLALLPSGMRSREAPASTAWQPTATPPTAGLSTTPTSTTHPDSPASSAPGNTSAPPTPQGSSGTTAAGPEPAVRLSASTLGASAAPTPAASTAQAQTSAAGSTPRAPPSTSVSDAGPKETPWPSTSAGRTSEPPWNNTSATTAPAGPLTSRPPTPGAREGKIVCSQVKEVRLTRGICLELNETSSCEDFRKHSGEELAQVLCRAEPAGAGPCSWLLAQSEVRPHCLLLVTADGAELSSKLQFLREHQSDLTKLGIHSLSEEAVSQHQSYSRKTLIALVTSGVLLAVLGITGYFLMNRRSWSPSGERLDEDPYYTEHGAGPGRGAGPETSPGAQGKARGPRAAQENGTGQATSRNGHSPRQHVVADTEL